MGVASIWAAIVEVRRVALSWRLIEKVLLQLETGEARKTKLSGLKAEKVAYTHTQ